MMTRGRFAPSPTGALHMGSAATALFAAASVLKKKGEIILRVEDLDTPRVLALAEEAQQDDLAWLGIRFDEGPREGGPTGPYRQSERRELYDAALAHLARRGLTYFCDCSRAEIARAASAPHEGEEGPRYPGTCRAHGMNERAFRRPPAVRLAIPAGAEVTFTDLREGQVSTRPADAVGDFVLRRGDGVYAYQLAVVVDDIAMGITEIVRGADLASSAGRQALLAMLLGAAHPPSVLHVPLMVEPESGERLAKRVGLRTVADQRRRGVSSGALLSAIARAYGHEVRPSDEGAEILARVAAIFDPARLPRGRVPVPDVEAPQ